jgi:4-hydroxybenzoate polyprenyltransferase
MSAEVQLAPGQPAASRRRRRRIRSGTFARAWLGLFHPGPSIATTVIPLVCWALLGGSGSGWLPLSVMVMAQQFAISVHNDWCDRTLDARTKPWRALPLGLLSPGNALALSAGLAGASVAASALLGLDEVTLNALGLAAGFSYNAWLKRTVFSWLPFAVAFPLLALFAMAALDLWPDRWPLVFAFGAPTAVALHLGDTLPDLESDRQAGVHGLAHRLGPKWSARVGQAAFLVVAAGILALTRHLFSPTLGGIAAILQAVAGFVVVLRVGGDGKGVRTQFMCAALISAPTWLSAVLLPS